MKIQRFAAALRDLHPGAEFNISGGDAQEIIPATFEWFGTGTAPTVPQIEAHYLANVEALTPQPKPSVEAQLAQVVAIEEQLAHDMWSTKTILAHMPYRWDPDYGAPLVEVAIAPPAAMPTDNSSADGLFDFLGTQGRKAPYQNPIGLGACALGAHSTSTGIFPNLLDRTSTIWRTPRTSPLSSQYFDIEFVGKHQFKLTHFAYRKNSTSTDMFKTFHVFAQKKENDVLVWAPLGRVSCSDASKPDGYRWITPIAISGATEFLNRYRFVPVSDWSGSTDPKDGRMYWQEIEVYGVYRGPFA